jgi:hypothetical protein
MKQSVLADYESSDVECPVCGYESEAFKGYAIHFGRSGGHEGSALVPLAGKARFEDLYWDNTRKEMADILGVGTTTLENAINEHGLPSKNHANRVEREYGVPLGWLLDTLHNVLEKTTYEMGGDLGVSRSKITRWMDNEYDVPRRDMSEARRLDWSQMDESERGRRVADAHEAVRNDYASFRTNANGYESWRCGRYEKQHTVKVHRLLAVAEYGFDAVRDSVVHHGKEDGRLPPCAIPWANWGGNVELFDTHSDHMRHHLKERHS